MIFKYILEQQTCKIGKPVTEKIKLYNIALVVCLTESNVVNDLVREWGLGWLGEADFLWKLHIKC